MEAEKLRLYLKRRIVQLERDRTMSGHTKAAKIAENRRLLMELGTETDEYSNLIREK